MPASSRGPGPWYTLHPLPLGAITSCLLHRFLTHIPAAIRVRSNPLSIGPIRSFPTCHATLCQPLLWHSRPHAFQEVICRVRALYHKYPTPQRATASCSPSDCCPTGISLFRHNICMLCQPDYRHMDHASRSVFEIKSWDTTSPPRAHRWERYPSILQHFQRDSAIRVHRPGKSAHNNLRQAQR